MSELDHERYMRRAIELTANAPSLPFAAVIVHRGTGEVVAEGWNRTADNPTLHGEIDAINNLIASAPALDRSELVLYTTAEPCPMCQGAILWTGSGRSCSALRSGSCWTSAGGRSTSRPTRWPGAAPDGCVRSPGAFSKASATNCSSTPHEPPPGADEPACPVRARRHRPEQNRTRSQSRAHFFRQVKGLPHVTHVFHGKSGFFLARGIGSPVESVQKGFGHALMFRHLRAEPVL